MPKYPEDLQILISALKKLPGIGSRTAERFAFEFINWSSDELAHFGHHLADIRSKIPPCPDLRLSHRPRTLLFLRYSAFATRIPLPAGIGPRRLCHRRDQDIQRTISCRRTFTLSAGWPLYRYAAGGPNRIAPPAASGARSHNRF